MKTFDEIMAEISAGLTGDNSIDIKYLREQMEKYKDHEFSQEIIRACGRMFYELIPDEKKEELTKLIGNEQQSIESTLEEIQFNIYKKDFSKAMRLSSALVNKLDKSQLFEDDAVSIYFTFNDFFEEALYSYYEKPEKTIRQAPVPLSRVYLVHGSLLFEQREYLEARKYLEKACRWNPADLEIAFEYMETFKVVNELDKFFNLTLAAFKYATSSHNLARCYRNLGYYFVEKEKYNEAAGCILLSMQYDNNNVNAQSELYYIHSKAGDSFKEPTLDEIEEYGNEYGFPICACDEVIGIAYAYGKHFIEEKNNEAALFALGIVYDLTDDADVKKMIEKITN